jgi:hypothetical protein
LAASASATSLTSPSGTIYTGEIKAESEGHVVLDNPIATIECASNAVGKVESHGEGVATAVSLSSLAFTGCTNSWHVTVVSAGSMQINSTGGSNGTVTSTGATIEATRFGITCRYATSGTTIGTLTGGTPATLHIEAAVPFHSGSFLCGAAAVSWTGSYKVTSPSTLLVEAAVPDQEGHFVSTGTALARLVGTETGSHVLEWTIDGFEGGIVCDESNWEDLTEKETENELIFFPTFAKCHTTGSAENFEIKMNGCALWLYAAKNTNNATEQTARLDCGNKPAEILHPKCTAKVPSHANLESLTYPTIELNGKHAITADFKHRLAMETSGECGVAKKQGWLEGSLTIEAFDRITKAAANITAT